MNYCVHKAIESFERIPVEINAGEKWINKVGYIIKILDTGVDDLWCEWENGRRGSWSVTKFIQEGYKKCEDKEAIREGLGEEGKND